MRKFALGAAFSLLVSQNLWANVDDHQNLPLEVKPLEGDFIVAFETERPDFNLAEIIGDVRNPNPLMDLVTDYMFGIRNEEDPKGSWRDKPTYVHLVNFKLNRSQDPQKFMKDIETLPFVKWVSPNFSYEGDPREFIPNDPYYAQQFYHDVMGNLEAWNISVGHPDIIVAVTDDGVDIQHPDLRESIWTNFREIPNNQIDDDENGYIDDYYGYDFSANDSNVIPPSGSAHGTHVAGIITGQIHNMIGIAGTASGATLMPLRFYGSGTWTSTKIAKTYQYAVDNGARVISTSYNVDGFINDRIFSAALEYVNQKGALHFNSAGNNSQMNPPRQKFDQLILVCSTVAQTGSIDQISSFTNTGTGVDLCAPGSNIMSTVPNRGFRLMSGTSMATPNAAAVAALIWSNHLDWTSEQVAAQLYGTSDNINAINRNFSGLLGAGRVNSYRGLTETVRPPRIRMIRDLVFITPTNTQERELAPSTQSLTVVLDSLFDRMSIENSDSFDLRTIGTDLLWGTADDQVIPLTLKTPYRIGSNAVAFEFPKLEDGLYRLTAKAAYLKDPFGQALDGNGDGIAGDDFSQVFEVRQGRSI